MTVSCYAGAHYPERPQGFAFQGQWMTVAKVERRWREPGKVHFLIHTQDGEPFRLAYDVDSDLWTIQPMTTRRAKR